MPRKPAPKSDAERKAAQRERGRQIAVILRDEAAIARLDLLTERHGSQRAALEALLRKDAGR